MERLYVAFLLLAVYGHVTAKSGIAQASLLTPNLTTAESGIAQASLVSPNLTTAESGIAPASLLSPNLTTAELGIVQASTLRVLIEESNDMKKRGFKAKEVANSTSYKALSPSGPDPSHDYTNMPNTNLANSTSYNSYGALSPSGADPYHDCINRSNTNGATSGNRSLNCIFG